MPRSTDRILTTHPGRLPNPDNYADVQAVRASGDTKKLSEIARPGIVEMIRRQKEIGIDIMSDGEFWKGRDQNFFDKRVTGIKQIPLKDGELPTLTMMLRERHSPEFKAFFEIYDRVGNTPRPGVVNPPATTRWSVADKVTAVNPGAAMKEEVELVKAGIEAAGEKIENFFFPVLGPGWLDHSILNDHYEKEEDYVYALAEVAKHDFKAVADAGFVLQIDDPGLVDTWPMLTPIPTVEEYRARCELRIEATNWALEGIPEEQVRFHTCWGSWHTPHVTDLHFRHTVDIMLKVKALYYSVEAADVQHVLDYEIWEDGTAKLPDGKIYIPGVIAHKTSTVEPPEWVAHQIVHYAKIMGKENIIAGTDCGLGGRCYPDIAWAKFKALAEGAALASKELW
jgi:5-methyltetrahydropteroyltriglutamate--homocysteine methyltransferase